MVETTVTISMRRSDGGTPWGFKVQGGQEFGSSISIESVTHGSLADRAGLQVGDKLNNLQGSSCNGMTHSMGHNLIGSATSSLDLVVRRLGGAAPLSSAPWSSMEAAENSSKRVEKSTSQSNYSAANKVNTSIQQYRSQEPNIPGYNVSAAPWGNSNAAPPSQAPPPVPQQVAHAAAPPPQAQTQNTKIIHAQYNSPSGLYSSKNTAQEYLNQTGGLFGTDPSLQKKEEPSYMQSETLRLIQETERGSNSKGPPMGRRSPLPGYAEGREHTLHQTDANVQSGSFNRLTHSLGTHAAPVPAPAPVATKEIDVNEEEQRLSKMSVSNRIASYQQTVTEGPTAPSGFGAQSAPAGVDGGAAPACDACGRFIMGVYCKAGGRSLHPECFNCSTCGSNLKNNGYFNVNQKLYCETHAKQVQGGVLGPKPAIDPNAFNPTSYPMELSNRSIDPPRAFYQPEILKPGPLGRIQPPAAPWRGKIGGASLSPSSRGIPSAPNMYAAPPSDIQQYGNNYNTSSYSSFKSSNLTSSNQQQNGTSVVAPISSPQYQPAPVAAPAHFAPDPAPFNPAPAPFTTAPISAPFTPAAPLPTSAPFGSAPQQEPEVDPQPENEHIILETERSVDKSEYDIPSGITEQQQAQAALNSYVFEFPEQTNEYVEETGQTDVYAEPSFTDPPLNQNQSLLTTLEYPLPYRNPSASKPPVYEPVENPYKSELLDMINQEKEESSNQGKVRQQPTWHPRPLVPPIGGWPEKEITHRGKQWPPKDTREVIPSWRLNSMNGQDRPFGEDGAYGIRPGDPDYLKVIWYRKSQHIKEKDKRPPSPLREMMRRDGMRASLPANLRSKTGRPVQFGSSQLQGLGVKTEPVREGVPDDSYGPFIPADQPQPITNLSPKLKKQMKRDQYAPRLQEMGFNQRGFDENESLVRSRITLTLQEKDNIVESQNINATAVDLVEDACDKAKTELEQHNKLDSTVDALLHLAHDLDGVANKLSAAQKNISADSEMSLTFAQQSYSSNVGLHSTVNQENVMPVFAPRHYKSGGWTKQDSLESSEVAMTMQREVVTEGEDTIVRQFTHQSIRPQSLQRSGVMPMSSSPANVIQSKTIESFNSGSGAKWTPTAESGGKTSGSVQPRRGKGILKLSHDMPRVPVCEACHREIRGPFILAMNKTWDPECFACANAQCHRKLQDIGFVEENGQNYCEVCFEKYLAPQCAKCFKPVTGDCLNALDRQWHPQCFSCAHCAKVFGNSAFYLEEGKAYCETDWNNLFTTKCVACEFAIEAGDRWVEALGHAYHSECFQCTTCSKPLEGQSFYAKGGHPYCKTHA